jgi:DNA-binding transcriptional regulator YiaG
MIVTAVQRSRTWSGKELRAFRKWLNLSAWAFGEDIGVYEETIYRWENDKHPIPKTAQILLNYMTAEEGYNEWQSAT